VAFLNEKPRKVLPVMHPLEAKRPGAALTQKRPIAAARLTGARPDAETVKQAR
jgi:hypothetical protein